MDNQVLALWLPIMLGALLIGVAGWVLQDARSHEKKHRPVTVTVLGLTVESSSDWAALCLLLFALAFPLYLVARRANN